MRTYLIKMVCQKGEKGEEKGFVQKVDVNAACRSSDNDRVHGGTVTLRAAETTGGLEMKD